MARDPRFDVLFEPVRIGPKTLRNRFYAVPHSTGFGSDRPASQAAFRAMKAEGGWAGVSVELTSIDPESDRNPVPVPVRLWDDDDAHNLAVMAEAVHAHGSLAGVELWHGGSAFEMTPSRLVPVAPSPLPNDAYPLTYPAELDHAGIRRIQRAYVEAAARARDSGFDIVYVYGGHGYLPMQFLSAFYNQRQDAYGGSLANRARFWRETLELVRTEVGGDCAIAVRIGLDPSERAGISVDEAIAFVRMVDELVDLWDVNTSVIAEPWMDMRPSRLGAQGYQTAVTGRIREATTKPIVGVGRLTDPELMLKVIRSGVWDLIGAARPSIADPFLPRKIEEGRLADIRECIGCNFCIARIRGVDHIACTQNATIGEEYRRGWHPENVPRADDAGRDALVVGAGPAGLECALVLARSGLRRIHVVEAAHQPGGLVRWVSRLPGLGEWRRIVDYRLRLLSKLRSVEIFTDTQVDADAVADWGADVVILATGSHWATDGVSHLSHAPIPGADASLSFVLTPEQVMLDDKPVPEGRVIVYDCEGYFAGVGMAEHLAGQGHRTVMVTPHSVAAPFLDQTLEGPPTRARLRKLGVEMLTETMITSVQPGGCAATTHDADHHELVADAVVLVTARRSNDSLYRHLVDHDHARGGGVVYRAGDCVAPRMIGDAVFDAHRVAREVIGADQPGAPYRRERRLIQGARSA